MNFIGEIISISDPSLAEKILEFKHLCSPKNSTKEWCLEVASIAKRLQSGKYIYIGICDNQKIIALSEVALLDKETAEISNLAVAIDRRRQGFGEKLLGAVLQKFKTLGVRKILLETRVSNEPAIRLYKLFGFKEDGIRKNYYKNPDEDALLMSANT
ncbi:MAG TPA: ribosomal protein S18-alanine N-acetyltransferase [Oligoflexia bacterium]|nr:ribosomal protein S18-alanine N-acetyltransferase [Oligoflexia bacterium]HMP26642.1 ribosomal protein S18-alanine N-acetyltransferase [Oligoflexia bacterium]